MRRAKKLYRSNLRGARAARAKESIWRNRSFPLAVIFGIIIFAGFYFLAFSPYFQIKEVRVEGAQKMSGDMLRDFVSEALVSKILFWPTKSIFAVNVAEIEKTGLAQFPPIYRLTIKRKLPNELLVKVVERTSVGQLCASGKCYMIDSTAVIFEQETETNPNTGLVIKLDDNSALTPGKPALTEAQMANILALYKSASEKYGIALKEIAVADKKLTAKTSEGWEIYFDANGNIAQQISNFEALVDKILWPRKRVGLEYIDLRFGDKVYYK